MQIENFLFALIWNDKPAIKREWHMFVWMSGKKSDDDDDDEQDPSFGTATN